VNETTGDTGAIFHREVTGEFLDAATQVHRELGPGLLESIYEECVCHELRTRAVPHARQVDIPVIYRGVRMRTEFRADLIVRGLVLVELKSVDRVCAIDEAKLINRLRLSGIRVGLLINFNVVPLKDGITRRVI